MSQAEVERATSSRVHAGFGVPGPAARDTLDGDEPSVHIGIPTGPVTPSAEEKPCASSERAPYRRWCRWCAAVRTAEEPHLREQLPEQTKPRQELCLTLQSSSKRRIERCQRLPSTRSMTDQRAPPATLCFTKAFSELLAFVEVLGHNVGDATLRPRTCVGAVVENCTEQTFRTDVDDTWSKNQSSESEQD